MDEINTHDNESEIVLGIDLGTRFSCVSVWRDKKLEIITDSFGNKTVPSVVAFYKSARLIGHNALSIKDLNPLNTIYDVKRIIGRRSNDPAIEQTKKIVSYIISNDEENVSVELDGSVESLSHKKHYHPEEISAMILTELKRMAKNYLGREVNKAVITVPAYFNDSQRQATMDAAKIAGLDVIKIINEPTAAALAYGLGSRNFKKEGGNILIYDFGAGTLDVSLINISDGVFKTLSVSGNTHLGGEDIDYLLMSHVISDFRKKHKLKKFELSQIQNSRLKNICETAKKILSSSDKTIVCLEDFHEGLKLYSVLSRQDMNRICNELFILAIKPIHDAIESAELTKNDIDDVVLVGGTTKVPRVRDMILQYFEGSRIKNLNMSLNPDEVVSAGAAIYGYVMENKDDPFSENIVLLDITPLSLGIETLQKQMTVIIPRNSVIPTTKTQTFSTDTDFQDTVTIRIFEGERKLTRNNHLVGTFDLSGFEKGPRGHPVIKITFKIDSNGILSVSAEEKNSGANNFINITSNWGAKGRLSKKDIDQLIKEASEYERIDSVYNQKINFIYKINSISQIVLRNIEDDAFLLSPSEKKRIRKDIKSSIKILDSDLSKISIELLKTTCIRLSDKYSHMMININKNDNDMKSMNSKIDAAKVHGDDDEDIEDYHHVETDTDYSQEEIKNLKSTITTMINDIMAVINNPITKLMKEHIDTIQDYLDTVNIWLWTTSDNNTSVYVNKIDEINVFTQEILNEYENKEIFDDTNNFSSRDELQITCKTLSNSLKSNFFSLNEKEVDRLKDLINETICWLIENPEEDDIVYANKMSEISTVCDNIYQAMQKEQIIEDSEEETDDEIEIVNTSKLNERIEQMLNSMPDDSEPDEDAVLLKIDMNKLNRIDSLQYKNPV